MKRLNVLILAVIVAMTGCATNQYGPKQTAGGLTGAALGGLLGAQFGSSGRHGHGDTRLATTAIGVLVGGLIGSEIGRSMDKVDRMKANQAVVQAHSAPLGTNITWNNPNNGHHGSITPTRDGTSQNGDYCREFHQTVTIGGKTQDAYGTACRQPDGTWHIVQQQ
jgi:surface antigen